MATLQDQSDAAFSDDGGDDILSQIASEQARSDSDGYLVPEFADEDGADDYPVPPELESDGKGVNTSTADAEFADDETNPGAQMGTEEPAGEVSSQEPQTQERHDIHTPADDKPQPAADGLSDAMIDRASEYGMHASEARATFKSDAELKLALFQRDQAALAAMQQQVAQQPPQQAPAQQQPMPPQQQAPEQQTPEQLQAQIEAYQLQGSEDVYDDTLLAEFKGMSEHHQKLFMQQQERLQRLDSMVQAQHQFLTQQQQHQQQIAAQRELETFDKSLVDLGDEWSDVFGNGSYDGLDQSSAEIFNRGKVLRTYNELSQMHQQQGRRVNHAAILESSLNINFPERQATVASTTGSSRDPKTGRYTNKPTGKSNQSAAAKDRYAAMGARWDKAFGRSDGGFEDDVDVL